MEENKREITFIKTQLIDTYTGDPWFGRSVTSLLNDVEEQTAFVKRNNQHSILELVWHMVTWREVTAYCLQPLPGESMSHFELMDWRDLDHSNQLLWQKGRQQLDKTQEKLVTLLEQQDDSILKKIVPGKKYNFRKLITGIIQHDIYHLGQIAYINKQATASNTSAS